MTRADLDRSARRVFLWAYGVWILGVFAFFVPAATWSPVSRFSLTRSVVESRSLTIDAHAASTGDRARTKGHWYTDKAPFPSLLAAPAYAIVHAWDRLHGVGPRFSAIETPDMPAKRVLVNRPFQRAVYVCSLTTAGLAGALLALAIFELVRRRATATAALVASELVILGTPVLPYSTSFYGHVVAGACLLGAILLLDQEWRAEVPRFRALVGAGACLAAAPGSEYLTAVPALLIGTWYLVRLPRSARRPAIEGLIVGAVGPLLILAIYQYACFGAPWRTGYSFITRPEFMRGHASGFLGVRLPSWEAVWGLSFGVRRGLFYIAPVTAIGLGGLVLAAFRDRDPIARVSLAAFGALGWLNSSYYMWWGGAAAGPRHLVPLLGVLALGLGRAWRTPALRPVILALGAVSVANAIVITSVGLEAPEYDDVLRRYAWRAFLDGHLARLSGASSLGLRMGLKSWASLWPLGIWLVVGQLYVLRLLSSLPSSSSVVPDATHEAQPEP